MPSIHTIFDKILAFCLRDVARYRFNVIRKNLSSSFSYTSEAELDQDVRKNYRFLAKIIRQMIFIPSYLQVDKSLTIKPYLQLDHWLNEGKSVIITMGHTGNWEWASGYVGVRYPGRTCVIYIKLKSKRINYLLIKLRIIMKV